MIAVDTSSFIAYFADVSGEDVETVDEALALKQVVIPPVVLSEILSMKTLPKEVIELLKSIELLEIDSGYWERVGELRRSLSLSGRKARLADTMIARSCIDHRTSLITRDADFSHFTKFGLKLAVDI